MMSRPLLAALALVASIVAAAAETPPFDMTPERGTAPAAAEPLAAAPSSEPAEATPDAVVGGRHYLLPAGDVTLSGETDRLSWSIFLSDREAASGGDIKLGYGNSILVAPELSDLTLTVNGTPVGEAAIAAVEKPAVLSFPLPADVLRVGVNRIDVAVRQRHRTDCTLASTYELWTRIDAASTYLATSTAEIADPLAFVRAIGADGEGRTEFDIVAPGLGRTADADAILRLAENLSLLAGMPDQTVSVSADAVRSTSSGRLSVVIGTTSELESRLGALPEAAGRGPFVRVMNIGGEAGKGAVLAVGGPDWRAVALAVDRLVRDGTAADAGTMPTARWQAPDAPLALGDNRWSLADLGYRTEEFSGRRFSAAVSFALPGDFYARDYGEMLFELDAAFSAEVLPGSTLTIQVNGQLASAVPVNFSDGGLFRRFPVRVTMRHLHPGLNRIAIETDLKTAADAVCAPGATGSGATRFVLFDTTSIRIPQFARIGQYPDLAAVTQIGRAPAGVVPLVVDQLSPAMLSAAATLAGKLSLKAGRRIDYHLTTSWKDLADGPAVIVSTAENLPADLPARFNLAADLAAAWHPAVERQEGAPPSSTLRDWQERLPPSAWARVLDWADSRLGLSGRSFGIFTGARTPYRPPESASVLFAAGGAADNAHWLLVTAPSSDDLVEGMDLVADEGRWQQLSGYVATYRPGGDRVETVSMPVHLLWPSVDTAANLRLVAANWLSSNIPAYVGLVVFMAILLGLATGRLMAIFGRRK